MTGVVAVVAAAAAIIRAGGRARRAAAVRDRLPVAAASDGASRASLERIGGVPRRALESRGRDLPAWCSDRTAGAVVVSALVGLLVLPPAGMVVAAVPALVAWWRSRRIEADRHRRLVEDLPDAVDLVRLAASAGGNPLLAVDALGRHGRGVVAEAARRAVDATRWGAPLQDAIGAIDALGPPAAPLADALRTADRHGAPLVPALERAAVDARLLRRRRAEVAARRVPIRLLFPLVLCTLPAFVLLTVVPLLARSFPDLTP